MSGVVRQPLMYKLRLRRPFAHVRGQRDNAAVHRNTISNFETGKFAGGEDVLAADQHTLKSAGVIFVAENGERA